MEHLRYIYSLIDYTRLFVCACVCMCVLFPFSMEIPIIELVVAVVTYFYLLRIHIRYVQRSVSKTQKIWWAQYWRPRRMPSTEKQENRKYVFMRKYLREEKFLSGWIYRDFAVHAAISIAKTGAQCCWEKLEHTFVCNMHSQGLMKKFETCLATNLISNVLFSLDSATVLCSASIPGTPRTILTHHQCTAFMICRHYLCEWKSQKQIRRNLSSMLETKSKTKGKEQQKTKPNQKPKKSDGRPTIAFHKLIPAFARAVAIYRCFR